MTLQNWHSTKLGELIETNSETYSARDGWEYINYLDTGNITDNRIDEISELKVGTDKIPSRAKRKVRNGDVIFSTVRPNQRHFGIIKSQPANFLVSTGFTTIRAKPEKANNAFIYWYLSQPSIVEFLHGVGETSTSAYPSIKPSDIEGLELLLPPLTEQKAIASILGALDDKIENNRRMNETLEEMARAIFKSWFVDFDPVHAKVAGNAPAHMDAETATLFPNSFGNDGLPVGWHRKSLDQIADFLNGAAMQKFPAEGDQFLPVIKIAELRNGISSNTNRATPDVPQKYLVSDGDVLFAWSGSLMQKVWTEGTGALNQHLFKVTSETYPKWFFYYWIDHHLKWFQSIAASKATTMGHIQRSHLTEAKVCVPDSLILDSASANIAPLLGKQIQNSLENKTLAELRDTLLPKLMSGEIRVKDAEREVEAAI